MPCVLAARQGLPSRPKMGGVKVLVALFVDSSISVFLKFLAIVSALKLTMNIRIHPIQSTTEKWL
jgi:hypothetical protein